MSKEIDIELVKSRLDYDPVTGKLTWKVGPPRVNCRNDLFGKEAGSIERKGYRVIGVGRKLYKAHRIAWAIFYGENPKNEIDHINGDKTDNRISNLREATTIQNCRNKPRYKNNTSGYKGVTFYKKIDMFQAKIKLNRKDIHIGYFPTAKEAHLAYKAFAEKIDGVFYTT